VLSSQRQPRIDGSEARRCPPDSYLYHRMSPGHPRPDGGHAAGIRELTSTIYDLTGVPSWGIMHDQAAPNPRDHKVAI
jgi:hypothetical protein